METRRLIEEEKGPQRLRAEELWALPHSLPEPPFLTRPWQSPPSFPSGHPALEEHGDTGPIQALQDSPWVRGLQPDYRHRGLQPDYHHSS